MEIAALHCKKSVEKDFEEGMRVVVIVALTRSNYVPIVSKLFCESFIVRFQIRQQKLQEGEARTQMPPVMSPREENVEIISDDPLLEAYDACRHLFTDITYGVKPRVSAYFGALQDWFRCLEEECEDT